jgi:nicotinamide riboside transporter PnuC
VGEKMIEAFFIWVLGENLARVILACSVAFSIIITLVTVGLFIDTGKFWWDKNYKKQEKKREG